MATCLPLGTSPLVLLPLPLQPVAGLFARAAKKLNSIFVQHSQLQSGCSPAAICSSIHSFECLHHRLCVPADGCPAALQFAIKVNLQLQLRQDACSSCRHDSSSRSPTPTRPHSRLAHTCSPISMCVRFRVASLSATLSKHSNLLNPSSGYPKLIQKQESERFRAIYGRCTALAIPLVSRAIVARFLQHIESSI